VVFRSELAILVGTLSLYMFAFHGTSITGVIIPAGFAGALIGLLCTVSIDSYFWQSIPLWPEWTAFYYNTVQGHSADWGVSPWYFYFINALPRLMMNPTTYLLCIPVAVFNTATRKRCLDLIIPLLGFVGLFSFLPHKEWRFIIYVVPGLTATAAVGASWIWVRRGKSIWYAMLSLILVLSVLLSFMASTVLLAVSSLNYPGGEAINHLHHHLDHDSRAHLHVYFDNLACQTGVTRFLENHAGPQTVIDVLEPQDVIGKREWTYSKTEDPESLLDPLFWTDFDYVLAERTEKIIGIWGTVHVTYGFGGVKLLKPGEKSGSTGEPLESEMVNDLVEKGWTTVVANLWQTLESLLRYRFLNGYWAEVRMEPKIRILKNRMQSSTK